MGIGNEDILFFLLGIIEHRFRENSSAEFMNK